MTTTGERHWELEEAERAPYRALSATAVVALGLGTASVLAFYHPALWLIPVSAIVTAILALRATSPTGRQLAGRQAAIWGLGLALLFGSWAPAHHLLDRVRLNAHAREFHEHWVRLMLQGERELVFQWTRPADQRNAPPPAPSATAPAGRRLPETAADYFLRDTPRFVASVGSHGQVRFVRTVHKSTLGRTTTISQEFELIDDRQATSSRLVVTSTREVAKRTRYAEWQIQDLATAEEFAARQR